MWIITTGLDCLMPSPGFIQEIALAAVQEQYKSFRLNLESASCEQGQCWATHHSSPALS
jgi:hypothetical protein